MILVQAAFTFGQHHCYFYKLQHDSLLSAKRHQHCSSIAVVLALLTTETMSEPTSSRPATETNPFHKILKNPTYLLDNLCRHRHRMIQRQTSCRHPTSLLLCRSYTLSKEKEVIELDETQQTVSWGVTTDSFNVQQTYNDRVRRQAAY